MTTDQIVKGQALLNKIHQLNEAMKEDVTPDVILVSSNPRITIQTDQIWDDIERFKKINRQHFSEFCLSRINDYQKQIEEL